MTTGNTQTAPYPDLLLELVDQLNYRARGNERLSFHLMVIDRSQGSEGLTLDILRTGPNSYNPSETIRVSHYFPVPPAAYNRESWTNWLFDRIGDVEYHERMENFVIMTPEGEYRPYQPNHGPGWDPYIRTVLRTETDERTTFTGKLDHPR